MATSKYTLNNRAALFTRALPDGRILDVAIMTYGKARLYLCAGLTVLSQW